MGAVTPTAWGWGGVRENGTGRCGSGGRPPRPPGAPPGTLLCDSLYPRQPQARVGGCGLDWSAGCGLGLRALKRQVIRGHP